MTSAEQETLKTQLQRLQEAMKGHELIEGRDFHVNPMRTPQPEHEELREEPEKMRIMGVTYLSGGIGAMFSLIRCFKREFLNAAKEQQELSMNRFTPEEEKASFKKLETLLREMEDRGDALYEPLMTKEALTEQSEQTGQTE